MFTAHRPLLSQSATQSHGHCPPGPQSPGPVPMTPGEPGCAAPAGPGAGGGGAAAAPPPDGRTSTSAATAAATAVAATLRVHRSGIGTRYGATAAAPATPRGAPPRPTRTADAPNAPHTPETFGKRLQLRTKGQQLTRKGSRSRTVHSSGWPVRFRSLKRRDPGRRRAVDPGEPGTPRPPHE
ncbi:hypothetical protein Slala02_68720 [Streptomyces lavendulae subsp. lavendulae]|nr:hypothetical protein Slala02_68720 [Streptomyces lavendulae subsp. lavendulae]